MLITQDNYQQLAWQKMHDLLPAIVQHHFSGKVLMQGYVNQAALEKTFSSRLVTFYSRSKQRLWTKGEQSGHHLALKSINADCDSDSLVILADPVGPTCHLGDETCWGDDPQPQLSFLADLEQLIKDRKHTDNTGSYTKSLLTQGVKRIAQKVGEEGVETALAAATGDKQELKNESADLLFHLILLLQASDLSLSDCIGVLQDRNKN